MNIDFFKNKLMTLKSLIRHLQEDWPLNKNYRFGDYSKKTEIHEDCLSIISELDKNLDSPSILFGHSNERVNLSSPNVIVCWVSICNSLLNNRCEREYVIKLNHQVKKFSCPYCGSKNPLCCHPRCNYECSKRSHSTCTCDCRYTLSEPQTICEYYEDCDSALKRYQEILGVLKHKESL